MEKIIIYIILLLMNNKFDNLSSEYDNLYIDEKSQQENTLIYNRLCKMIKKEDKIIDIGCGTGFLLDLMKEKIHISKYIGIDSSPGMLKKARIKYPDHLFILNNAGSILINNNINFVIALFSLNYIKDISNIIKQIKDRKYFFCMLNEKRINSKIYNNIYRGIKYYHYLKDEIYGIFKKEQITEIGEYYYISNEKL